MYVPLANWRGRNNFAIYEHGDDEQWRKRKTPELILILILIWTDSSSSSHAVIHHKQLSLILFVFVLFYFVKEYKKERRHGPEENEALPQRGKHTKLMIIRAKLIHFVAI